MNVDLRGEGKGQIKTTGSNFEQILWNFFFGHTHSRQKKIDAYQEVFLPFSKQHNLLT